MFWHTLSLQAFSPKAVNVVLLGLVAVCSRARSWENLPEIIPRLRFFFVFFKWRFGRAYSCHFLGQDQSTVALRAETTVVWCSLTSCVDLVDWEVPTVCQHSGIVSPLRLRWVTGLCVFSCNLPSALLAEWPGSFTCQCGNPGVERTQNKSQHKKLTLEKKILPLFLPGIELATFRSRVRRSNNKLPGSPTVFFFLRFLLYILIGNTRFSLYHDRVKCIVPLKGTFKQKNCQDNDQYRKQSKQSTSRSHAETTNKYCG